MSERARDRAEQTSPSGIFQDNPRIRNFDSVAVAGVGALGAAILSGIVYSQLVNFRYSQEIKRGTLKEELNSSAKNKVK